LAPTCHLSGLLSALLVVMESSSPWSRRKRAFSDSGDRKREAHTLGSAESAEEGKGSDGASCASLLAGGGGGEVRMASSKCLSLSLLSLAESSGALLGGLGGCGLVVEVGLSNVGVCALSMTALTMWRLALDVDTTSSNSSLVTLRTLDW
jgi:hypothetical protein